MRDYFKKVAAFAEELTIRGGDGEKTARAFIQPINSTSPEYEKRPTPMGFADDRRYLIIAELSAFEGGEILEICSGEKVYELLRRELIGGSHWEGIMRLKGGSGNAD